MSIWDDPDLKIGGEFFKFENVGDTIGGTIHVVRVHRFDDGTVAPQLLLTTEDGTERTVTAGAILLKRALAEHRPEAGDTIVITLTEIEKRAGGKELKHFEVLVDRGDPATSAAPAGVPPAAATTSTSPTAAPAAPSVGGRQLSAEAEAALAQLSPEQRATLGFD